MAESVDALVSNTSGATRAGSTPALGTKTERKLNSLRFFLSPAKGRKAAERLVSQMFIFVKYKLKI